MNLWSSLEGVLQWDNIEKRNHLNGGLNGGLDVRTEMVICMNYIYI